LAMYLDKDQGGVSIDVFPRQSPLFNHGPVTFSTTQASVNDSAKNPEESPA
jgi:hypothetical protein